MLNLSLILHQNIHYIYRIWRGTIYNLQDEFGAELLM